jgi:hypothetical protein
MTSLREAKPLGKYSPGDMIGVSKTVYRLKTRGAWGLAEVTASVRKPLAKAGIGCLNERS